MSILIRAHAVQRFTEEERIDSQRRIAELVQRIHEHQRDQAMHPEWYPPLPLPPPRQTRAPRTEELAPAEDPEEPCLICRAAGKTRCTPWHRLCRDHPPLARATGWPQREPTPPQVDYGDVARLVAMLEDAEQSPIVRDALLDLLAPSIGRLVVAIVDRRAAA